MKSISGRGGFLRLGLKIVYTLHRERANNLRVGEGEASDACHIDNVNTKRSVRQTWVV